MSLSFKGRPTQSKPSQQTLIHTNPPLVSAPIHGWWIIQSQMTSNTEWPWYFFIMRLCVLHRAQSLNVPLQDKDRRWGASADELCEDIPYSAPNLYRRICYLSLKTKQKTYLVTKAAKTLPLYYLPLVTHEKEEGSLWEFYPMLTLKFTAGMINYYFSKTSFSCQDWLFLIPSHGNFREVCRQKTYWSGWSRWHNKTCDRRRSHTLGPNAYGLFA